MLYTLAVFVFGIYIGQEYKAVPSIRVLGTNLMAYLQSTKDPEESVSFIGRIIKSISTYKATSK